MRTLEQSIKRRIKDAALNQTRVIGHTHTFYRYPARFSPKFVAQVIDDLSNPGDLILDPFMGGATTIVEAMASGRRAIGSDINELSVFVARAKTTSLNKTETHQIKSWLLDTVIPSRCTDTQPTNDSKYLSNMSLPQSRWIRKTLAQLLFSLDYNNFSNRARQFARCVLLNSGQWALDGRRHAVSAHQFRQHIYDVTINMLEDASTFRETLKDLKLALPSPVLLHEDAELIYHNPKVLAQGPADLVVTSPPYPGIHLLYHRWQVDGRKETNAPYWISGCVDGAGASHYNFADRRPNAEHRYFAKVVRSFSSIRKVMRTNSYLVQIVAFQNPKRQMPKYLNAMQDSGFEEIRDHGEHRIWRQVPGRRWHANSKGELPSSREVVLIHRATR